MFCKLFFIFDSLSGDDSIGHGGHVLPPPYKWVGTGGTVSRRTLRTANKKLTRLY